MRWILVDRFLEFDGARRALAVKNVSAGEDFAAAHFPGLPIFPGSLILEGLAQTGGILVARAERFEKKVILAKVESAQFLAHARPGDQLLLEAVVIERRPEGFKVQATATIAPVPSSPAHGPAAGSSDRSGRLAVKAVLMFVNLSGQQAGGELPENFVFTPEFLGLFRGVDVAGGDVVEGDVVGSGVVATTAEGAAQ